VLVPVPCWRLVSAQKVVGSQIKVHWKTHLSTRMYWYHIDGPDIHLHAKRRARIPHTPLSAHTRTHALTRTTEAPQITPVTPITSSSSELEYKGSTWFVGQFLEVLDWRGRWRPAVIRGISQRKKSIEVRWVWWIV
jgi:hypothetical protein